MQKSKDLSLLRSLLSPGDATLLHRPQALPYGTVKDQPYLFLEVEDERVWRGYSLHNNTTSGQLDHGDSQENSSGLELTLHT